MKKKLIDSFIWLACFISMIFVLSGTYGCKKDLNFDEQHGEMWFLKERDDSGNQYYCAGRFSQSAGIRTHFIKSDINGIPVKQLGYSIIMNTAAGSIYANYDLENLYIPGSIEKIGCEEYFVNAYKYENGVGEYLHEGLKIFYCGNTVDLTEILEGAEYYVPSDRFDEFTSIFADNNYKNCVINKANVSYMLNYGDSQKYYYVDYVADEGKIVNIPPAPVRTGYDFGGWYKDPECSEIWDFGSDLSAAFTNGAKELNLYADWIKI